MALDMRSVEEPANLERGIGRYGTCLLEALASEPVEVVPLRDLRRPPAPARVREAFEHLLLARDALRAGADVLHSPTIALVSLRPGLPFVVTVHDLIPLKHPERYLRSGLKHRLRYAAVRRATRVIAPSKAVERDVERLLGIPSERITVIPEAAAPVFSPVADPRVRLERLRLPERFMLWVGGLDPPDPRKGVEPLAEAVREGDGLPLVLAGRASREATRLAAPTRVELVGRLSDRELAALYSAAEVLVFPSEDEGYGLPPVEALACGTPVVAYAAGSLPEVLGGSPGAELVDPGDLAGLLDAAESLAGSRVEPAERTWADVARETRAVYEAAATKGAA